MGEPLHSPKDVGNQPLRLSWCPFATRKDLKVIERLVMKAIDALNKLVADQKAFNTANDAAITSVADSVTAVAGDVKALNDKITELQNATGDVTPETQALIDEVEAQGTALVAKTQAAADALAALDALTPPVAPPVTP